MTKAAGASASAKMRRSPLQARGHRRVDLLLDAAAEVVAEVGVEAATTNAIAARAKTSVGSLYQFFDDKHALIWALSQRMVTSGMLANRASWSPDDPAKWSIPEIVERSVRSWTAFIDANPAYPAVARTVQATAKFGASELLAPVMDNIDAKLKLRRPKMPPRDRRIHAVMVAETMNTMLVRAAGMSRPDRERMNRELVAMLVRYLTPLYGSLASP
jgi:AcrR family transcriptional regulator